MRVLRKRMKKTLSFIFNDKFLRFQLILWYEHYSKVTTCLVDHFIS